MPIRDESGWILMLGMSPRPQLAAAGVAFLSLALTAACTSTTVPGTDEPTASPAPPAVIEITPADGTKGSTPVDGVAVAVTGGRLTSVQVATAHGDQVDGVIADDGASWSTDAMLTFDTSYRVMATAANPDGDVTTSLATFTTAKPKALLHTAIVPLNGETVGVGLPIQVQLSAAVTDKAEVERNLVVEAEPAVEGSWHWIGDDKLRYRPKEYWQPGTDVTIHVRLQGIDAGGGVYGDEQRDVSFTIGRSVRSVVDAEALKMTVYIDGKQARTIPITAGKPGFETRNGIKVALEKHKVKHMDARTVGIEPGDPDYYSLDVKWAVRMTWSGEFVHGAEWSTAQQGRERVSHGCVGMNLENAEWFFNQTHRGDIIEVVNSPTDRSMELDNGFGDWNVSWENWVKGSALTSG